MDKAMDKITYLVESQRGVVLREKETNMRFSAAQGRWASPDFTCFIFPFDFFYATLKHQLCRLQCTLRAKSGRAKTTSTKLTGLTMSKIRWINDPTEIGIIQDYCAGQVYTVFRSLFTGLTSWSMKNRVLLSLMSSAESILHYCSFTFKILPERSKILFCLVITSFKWF